MTEGKHFVDAAKEKRRVALSSEVDIDVH